MSSRRRVVTAGCVLALAVLSLMGPVAEAKRTPPAGTVAVSQSPPPGVMEALTRDLHLAPGQIMERLRNEARLTPVAIELRKKLGVRFGGSYFSGPTSATLTVASTSTADVPLIAAAGAQPRVVDKSLAELLGLLAVLAKKAPSPTADSIVVRFPEVRVNKVVVLSPRPAIVDDHIKDVGLDGDVLVRPSDERPKPLYDLVGGDAYYIQGRVRCSVGFSVRRGTQNAFVSAGHCGNAGNVTTGHNGIGQGVFQNSVFPVHDHAWIAVNSNWTPQPWVRSQIDGSVNVTSSAEAVEGAVVCRTGSTSGWHCGTVQQRGASVQYPEGTVSGLTRTSACAERGDSGGPFISGPQAQGVTSGGTGNCSSGGTTYFQPLTPILSAYGLTLTTAAATPPPQETEPCTGYARTVRGSLRDGQAHYQPGNLYYRSATQGVHSGCLYSPAGTEFYLYLQRWIGWTWLTVATSESSTNRQTVTYTGTPGYYRYRVVSHTGTGTYTLGFSAPS
ncbi:alpha-lytic protease prodomain-containing protein [Sphaerisporangium rubeum]|uniref:Serine protease n=1 Tax=Sphaerisporangium rubeum TaxID=321317 RepID=A0A7X0MA96_9ACTN|nr:S1 family peptidase [Sphaerisporangium rubeum]MBB6475849.1 hypothetical protein [Sphaerisporangium rubeum]